jgi:agmatine deiminase
VARIIEQIAPRERVEINVPNGNCERIVRRQLADLGCPTTNVFFHHIRTNECWCRDNGPAFVVRRGSDGRKQKAVVDWGFNAWGRKYPLYNDDDAVPTQIAAERKLKVFDPGIIMEGGAVDFNGQGTVLTTACCLLNKNRNPDLGKAQIEEYLKAFYGQQQVLWLDAEIAGDDTDGHVDDLARFIGPRRIVTAVEEDPRDVNYKALQDNVRRLRKLRDAEGRPFEIVELPMPGVVEHRGQRLPATYVNFYFVNGALLVPIYRHRRNDPLALSMLQAQLPKRKVIGVDCVELIFGRGAIHCLTQQEPRS